MCVVNTVPARETSRAASKPRPVSSVSSRIRSRPRKPAWPSLVWNTSGAVAPVIRENARMARTPPMPSSISWRSRCSVLPPYRRSVTVRMTSLFSSTSESSSSSGTRPTWATQTRAVSDCSVGQADDDLGDRAVVLAQQRQRQAVGVEDRVGLLLPAVARQRLAEVAVPVEQPDADDRHAEVARGLEVVAGQDAETAGVLRQHRGDAELRGEVADGRRQRRLGGRVLWYQRAPVMYCSRSARAADSRPRKSSSAASWSRRAEGTAPRNRTGSWPEASHARASTDAKRSWVSGCQDQRRLPASSPSACSGCGQDGTDGEPTDCSHAEHHNADRLERSNLGVLAAGPAGFRRSPARYVRAMVGRIPVMDVSPVVEGGRYPAKAAVGEPFSVSATIFREGHDELNADVVVADPDGKRRPPVRMTKDATEPDIWHAVVHAGRGRRLDVRDRVLERPGRHLAAQRRDQDPGRHRRGPDVHRGRLLLERARRRAAEALPGPQDASPTRSRRCATRRRPEPVRYAAAVSPEIDALLAEHPLRDLVTTEGPYPFFADRERALFGSWYEFFPRSEGAYVDEKTGTVVSGTLLHRREAARRGGRRWASTSSTSRRSTRSAG